MSLLQNAENGMTGRSLQSSAPLLSGAANPPCRPRKAKGEIEIYPLLIEPTPKAGLDRVRDFNLRPRDAKPFQSYSLAERNQHMSDAADEIAAIA